MILRDANVLPVSQPRILLQLNLELNTRIKSLHSELARLSKLAKIGQLLKLARTGHIFYIDRRRSIRRSMLFDGHSNDSDDFRAI